MDAESNNAFPAPFPSIVNVEVYRGSCPCRCLHCPVGTTPPIERTTRFGMRGIDLGIFRRIAAEVSAHPESMLRIHSVGEPLDWPELRGACDILQQTRVRTWVFTSAVTNDRSLLDKLCNAVTIIEVSINSINREDYLATKGIDAFNLVVTNIDYLYRRSRQASPTRLIVSRVQSKDTQSDTRFIEFWKSSGVVDDAFVRSYHTYNHLLPDLHAAKSSAPQGPCLVHWARFNVAVDGRAVVCFNELFKPILDPEIVLGDLHQQSIKRIWLGPKLNAIRQAHFAKHRGSQSTLGGLPCASCTSCQPLFGNHQTSEYQLQCIALELCTCTRAEPSKVSL